MANYANLIQQINASIKTNGANLITGQMLQTILDNMVASLGAKYQYAGVATPATNPGTPDQNVFYLAATAGTYPNFGGLVVAEGEVAALKYNGAWAKDTTGAASLEKVSQLGREVKDTYGDYIENPEWVKVVTDNEDKILYGVKTDGKFYFGGGCPPQVVEYITEKLGSFNAEDYADINTFLGNLIYGDTLAGLLNDKVDKKTGKSLIDANVAENINYIENPEWMKVVTDNQGKILYGVKPDGTIDINSSKYSLIQSSEWLLAIIDNNLNFVAGLRTNGSVEWSDGVPLPVRKFVYEKIDELTDASIKTLYPKKAIVPILSNYKLPDYQYGGSYSFDHENLTLLWFSDIHGSALNMKRIGEFYNLYKKFNNQKLIDDVLCTGDILEGNWNSDYSYWDANGGGPYLCVMGNHDINLTGLTDLNLVSQKAVYDRYFSPNISAMGITIQENHSYWYKDYPNVKSQEHTGGLRLIGLDLFHWKENLHYNNSPETPVSEYPDGTSVDTGQQETWFVNLLADARTNNMAVIVTVHSPTVSATKIDCTFDTLDTRTADNTNAMKQDMVDAVHDFIVAGGVFITWLCGHTHQDWVVTIDDGLQSILCVNTASYSILWRDIISIPNTLSMDKFDIISIEPKKKYIRLLRIGSNFDRHGRHLGSLVYDYQNKRVVGNF